MSTAEILEAVASGKMKPDEASKLLATTNGHGGLQISRNSKGGLFMRNTAWKAHSTEKDKDYVVSINIPWEFAKPFFSDTDAVKRVVEFVKSAK